MNSTEACIRRIAAGFIAAAALLTGCSSSGLKTMNASTITVTSGAVQTASVGKSFSSRLAVTVLTDGSSASSVSVTFTAPSSGPSGTFANGTTTETDITDSSGVATSSVFSANRTAGSYTVSATAAGDPSSAQFDFTNANGTTNTYSFYLSGLEELCGGGNYYALAGSVTIDSSGNVVSGEQDYNDANGCTSPEPGGDTISSGTLTLDANGQGTLTLNTSNANLGANGTETIGVQFVNSNHALIIQFDGTATSSGAMDLQSLPSSFSGGYAFTISGVDANYQPVARGGVFSVSGTTLANGIVDTNDVGTVTTGTAFSGTVSTPDSFGRGTITNTGFADTFVYYIVGPEVIRIIDVDAADSAVGSAFGQGSTTFTTPSLGSSIFTMNANVLGVEYAVAGMFTVPAAGSIQGVVDDDEQGVVYSAASLTGNYSTSNAVSSVSYNGYGNLSITPLTMGNFSFRSIGVYMTDPTLNLNDPNNPAGGGGALALALDPYFAGGTGVVIPQTDTATASFAGNYAFGGQDYYTGNPGWEFDFIGQGSVSSGDLVASGLVSDPYQFFADSPALYSGVPFSGTATPDLVNAGRYTITVSATAAASTVPFQVVIYQASGGQLFWIDEETAPVSFPNDQIGNSLWSGSIQQQGSLTGVPAVRKPPVRSSEQKR